MSELEVERLILYAGVCDFDNELSKLRFEFEGFFESYLYKN